MWLIAKTNKNEKEFFKQEIKKKLLGVNFKIYDPMVLIKKNFLNKEKISKKYILDNYVFFYSDSFNRTGLSNLKYLKGLSYILDGCKFNQKNIISFIEYCKKFEDKEGFIKTSFFKSVVKDKAKFITGPFANMYFNILEKHNNKIKVLIGKYITTISDKKNYLYQSI